MSREPWWAQAVLYRIDTVRFQDSDGDGRGDLRGVTERLEYLQALGVDALVLAMPDLRAEPEAARGFDELTRQAASRHLRVMVELTPDMANDAVTLAEARFLLNEGAAGLVLRAEAPERTAQTVRIVSLLHQLHALVGSFPGGRVLACFGMANDGQMLANTVTREAQLVLAPSVSLNSALDARLGMRSAGSLQDVLRVDEKPARARAAAVVLLGSANPVMIEAGQELGLEHTADDKAPLMQWTPTDVTVLRRQAEAQTSEPEVEFKAFRPYVLPPPRSLVGVPTMPAVVETDAPPAVDPELVPGFSTLAAAVAGRLAANGAAANVRDEEHDPDSVLSLYRRLVQLRHGDAVLRHGSQVFLNEDALGALVWVLRSGAETRLVAANLSGAPLHLSLDAELTRLKVRGGRIHDLVAGGASAEAEQRSDDVTLPAGGVLLGRVSR